MGDMASNGIQAKGEDNAPLKTNIDDLLPGDLLHAEERVIFARKPSLWTIAFLSGRVVAVCVILTLLTLWLTPKWGLGRLGGYIMEACAVVALGRIGYAVLQWLSRIYVLTDQRVIRVRGVFTIDIFQCTLRHLQNTFLVMTLPQRLLKLGNIAFTTAGDGGVQAVWRHLSHPLQAHHELIRAINNASNAPSPDGRTHEDGEGL